MCGTEPGQSVTVSGLTHTFIFLHLTEEDQADTPQGNGVGLLESAISNLLGYHWPVSMAQRHTYVLKSSTTARDSCKCKGFWLVHSAKICDKK